jgi:hypothetical protein
MAPTLLIALSVWIGANGAFAAAAIRRARSRIDRGRLTHRRAPRPVPVDGYSGLLLSRLVVQTCRVTGAAEACLLVPDQTDPAALVPVASHGLDEEMIGGRIARDAGGRFDLGATDGSSRGRSVHIPCGDRAAGGYLWVAAAPGAQLGDRQVRLLAELADLCSKALDDLTAPAELDDSIGQAVARITREDEPPAAARHVALARAVGTRLGLDGPALVELDIAARVQHAVPIAPPAAVRSEPGLESVAVVLRFAREHWDGRGPHGLRGQRIPLAARILAACEALGVPSDGSLRNIQAQSGSRFDPAVVSALSQELLGPMPAIGRTADHWADDDRLFAV